MSMADDRCWHECDLRAAPTNVRSWETNGLNAPRGLWAVHDPNLT
jgi:hypothetical protein